MRASSIYRRPLHSASPREPITAIALRVTGILIMASTCFSFHNFGREASSLGSKGTSEIGIGQVRAHGTAGLGSSGASSGNLKAIMPILSPKSGHDGSFLGKVGACVERRFWLRLRGGVSPSVGRNVTLYGFVKAAPRPVQLIGCQTSPTPGKAQGNENKTNEMGLYRVDQNVMVAELVLSGPGMTPGSSQLLEFTGETAELADVYLDQGTHVKISGYYVSRAKNSLSGLTRASEFAAQDELRVCVTQIEIFGSQRESLGREDRDLNRQRPSPRVFVKGSLRGPTSTESNLGTSAALRQKLPHRVFQKGPIRSGNSAKNAGVEHERNALGFSATSPLASSNSLAKPPPLRRSFVKGSLRAGEKANTPMSATPKFQKGPLRAADGGRETHDREMTDAQKSNNKDTHTNNYSHLSNFADNSDEWEDEDSEGDRKKKGGGAHGKREFDLDDDQQRPDGMDSEDWAFEKVLRSLKSGKPMKPLAVPTRKLDEVIPGEFCRLQI